jgi:hypothetical protein
MALTIIKITKILILLTSDYFETTRFCYNHSRQPSNNTQYKNLILTILLL